jgi:hypothetical protein
MVIVLLAEIKMIMKTYLTFIALLLSVGVFAQEKKSIVLNENLPNSGQITFLSNTHNFGKLTQGDVVTTTFDYVNTGIDSVRILSTKAGCGCTTPSYSKDPLAPGDTAQIIVQFNSRGKMGVFTKSVIVNHNGETAKEYLTIRGIIEKKTVEAPKTGQLIKE